MNKLAILAPIIVVGFLFGLASNTSSPISPDTIPQEVVANDAQNFQLSKENTAPTSYGSSPTNSTPFQSYSYKSRIGAVVQAPTGEAIVLKKYSTAATIDDPWANQWWETTVQAHDAWDMPAPAKQTILAVIDTGFAMQHVEFSGRFFQNAQETGSTSQEAASLLNCTDRAIPLDAACNVIDDDVDGIVDNETGAVAYENPSALNCTDRSIPLDKSCNRIDDDNNGYIDDTSGWDFVNQDGSPQAGELNPDGTGVRHGSMVMGIAAATGNNSAGIAGIDWNTTLLPLQAIDDDSYGDSLTVGNAIRYAADMGADVINMSLGTDGPDTYILNAVEYAYNKGAIVVAAAGNDGCNCMIYPASYDITLAVGASNQAGNRASFSSYGNALDIIAPGVSITSATFTSANGTTAYSTGNGTSFATPIVSGMLTKLKGQLPTATPIQLAALITEQTTQNHIGTPYKTTERGYGDVSFANSAERATQSKQFSQLYTLSGVTNGGVFQGSALAVPAYACEPGAAGTTPLYRGVKTKYFYSINPIDIRLGGVNTYTMQKLFNLCVVQPHDQIESIRALQTAQEFDTRSIKSLIGL